MSMVSTANQSNPFQRVALRPLKSQAAINQTIQPAPRFPQPNQNMDLFLSDTLHSLSTPARKRDAVPLMDEAGIDQTVKQRLRQLKPPSMDAQRQPIGLGVFDDMSPLSEDNASPFISDSAADIGVSSWTGLLGKMKNAVLDLVFESVPAPQPMLSQEQLLDTPVQKPSVSQNFSGQRPIGLSQLTRYTFNSAALNASPMKTLKQQI